MCWSLSWSHILFSIVYYQSGHIVSRKSIVQGLLIVFVTYTAWKVTVFGVILVLVFPHSDWIFRVSPYSVRMRENMDRDDSEYEHFLCSDTYFSIICFYRKDYLSCRQALCSLLESIWKDTFINIKLKICDNFSIHIFLNM